MATRRGETSAKRRRSAGAGRLIAAATAAVVAALLGAAGPARAQASTLTPAAVSWAAAGCECLDLSVTGTVEAAVLSADVLLAIDLTGSMEEERSALQANMLDIVDRLDALVPDLQFGLVSYRDYPTSATMSVPCPYSAPYGNVSDFPFRLNEPMTFDRTVIRDAVDALDPAAFGADAPEAYNRMMFEAAWNPDVGFRDGARRILVNFGDELPHDCNVQWCVGGTSPLSRGIDLGRDGLPASGDEIATITALDGLWVRHVTLLHLDSSPLGALDGTYSYTELWDCYARLTGGQAVRINDDGTVPSGIDLSELVVELIEDEASACDRLALTAAPGFESWLVDPGVVHADVELPAERAWNVRLCVPDGTAAGTHEVGIDMRCDGEILASLSVVVTLGAPCGDTGCGDVVAPVLVAGALDPCHDTVAEAEAAALAATTATDDSGVAPTLTATTVGTCPATITVEGRDACDNVAAVDYVVTIDPDPPDIVGVPADATVECDAVPPPAAPAAIDACDPAPVLAFTETRIDGSCPGRWTLVRQWTATDACGHSSAASQTVQVVDTTPPVVVADPGTTHCLWPPNHWHVPFSLDDFAVTATDACSGPVTLEIAGCASSQPDDDVGDGATTQDCLLLGPDSFAVRSERQGGDPAGRTYAVTVVATDACGNRSEPAQVGAVHVPHDQSPRERGCRDATKVGCRPGQAPPDCGR